MIKKTDLGSSLKYYYLLFNVANNVKDNNGIKEIEMELKKITKKE